MIVMRYDQYQILKGMDYGYHICNGGQSGSGQRTPMNGSSL